MNFIIVATVRPGLEFQGAAKEHKRRFLGEKAGKLNKRKNPKAFL